MNFMAANAARDRRLRRGLLFCLDHALIGPRGGGHGKFLWDNVGGKGMPDQFEDDAHVIRLIRDLVNKGLATERIEGLRKGQHLAAHHLFVRITDKGSMLLREQVPIDPDIEDERVEIT